jgi:serine/threonine-protein kinase
LGAIINDVTEQLTRALADRYTIERQLGSGGMATVYLAYDRKHDRQVAIKVLRPELSVALGDARFLREVSTTANLRHPNILPLYDSGVADGLLYYVMPYVEGETLRDRIDRERQLPIPDVLRIISEVAEALGYAHSRGIVHRDIKPENILIDSGHAVVADFGIARAIDLAGGERLTVTGLIIGTAPYMSPEQADGERDLDGRSDLYSLACVMYEMLAGRPPFTGPTAGSVINQHLIGTPPAITQLRSSVPIVVAETLDRALAKVPADRFATTTQFSESLARTTSDQVVRPRSVRRGPSARGIIIGASLLLLLTLTAIFLRPTHHDAVQLGRRTQVTLDPGLELDPALSPDGRFLAYSDNDSRLMVRQVEGGAAAVSVLRGDDERGRWPTWSSDGQRLLFISARGIEVVPALGGASRLLVPGTDLERGLAVAPDGRDFAYVSHDSLLVRSLDGANVRFVVTAFELHSPSWSPDGQRLAFVSGDFQFIASADLGNVARSSVWVVKADGGEPIRVSDDQSLNVSPAWLTWRDLLYISDREGGRDVYHASLDKSGAPEGASTRVTTGLSPLSISLTPNGRRLTYAAFTETSNIWSMEIPRRGWASIASARAETQGSQMIENIDVSFDGRWLAFSSDRGGGIAQIYRQQVGHVSSEPVQATTDSVASYWVAFSPAGNEIGLNRFQRERRQVFVMPVEGGEVRAVTDGSEDIRSPEWSRDNQRLVMLANHGTQPTLRTVTRTPGGWSDQQVLPVVVNGDTLRAGLSVWSPDGQWLACGCGEGGIVVIPSQGGMGHRLAANFSTEGWAFPQWSEDGNTVYFISKDSARQVIVAGAPIDGGPARVVVRFDASSHPWHRYGFRVRGNRMFLTLGDRQSDVWVTELGQ